MSSNDIDWHDVIKKEARGINDEDLGEVQDVQSNYVIIEKGLIDKEKFYIPKDQVESYDGNALKFRFSDSELSKYQDEPSTQEDETDPNNMEEELTPTQEEKEVTDEENIPLTEERMDISKKSNEDQETITKKPVKETKTVEVQLIREEIESIERRPPSDESEGDAQSPVQSPEEIKIPLKREEAEVTKKPYVKEEAVVKKKTAADKKEITDEVTPEELDTSKVE
ncbi:MAG TPA: YsnF/AvaK domain-containing protein [Nitrososphaeraceae archaeon]